MAITKKSLISNSSSSKSTSKPKSKVSKSAPTAKLATANRSLAKPMVAASAKTTFRMAKTITLARAVTAMKAV